MYKECIFDLYGTLADIRTDEEEEELWQTMAAEFSPWGMIEDPKELHREYHRLIQEETSRLSAQSSGFEPEIELNVVFAGLFRKETVHRDDPLVWNAGRRFRELSRDYIRLYEGVPKMLRTLREEGRRVWLLSNAQRIFTAYELDMLGITCLFDGIYLSSDYGCKKPDPAFFRILLRERKIEPAEAIMIGNDGTCDIAGAKQMGIATLYLHTATSPDGVFPEADYVLPEPDMKKVTEILLRA